MDCYSERLVGFDLVASVVLLSRRVQTWRWKKHLHAVVATGRTAASHDNDRSRKGVLIALQQAFKQERVGDTFVSQYHCCRI